MWKTQELAPDSPVVIMGVRSGPICYAFSIAAKIRVHGECEVRVRKVSLPDRNGDMRSVEAQFNKVRQLLCDSFGCEFKEAESNDGQALYIVKW